MSSPKPNSAYNYKVGGTLPSDDSRYVYVTRKADQDLYNSLKQGEFCYVLNPRQMGKSSLCIHTRKRLQTENLSCAAIEVTEFSSQDVTENGWYKGFISCMVRDFHLGDKFDLQTWWRQQKELFPVGRLYRFIEEVLLVEVPGEQVFIFLDEIDKVISLNFCLDDFFALIRFCYNQRAINPAYNRITFALFGVATPSDLIRDKVRTVFNIGKAIELTGFKWEEAQPLAAGLRGKTDNPLVVLREILNWTGGQPFLTQKLCDMVANSELPIPAGSERERVEKLVRSRVIENWETQDNPEHLRTIRNRILGNPERSGRLLKLYKKILRYGGIQAKKCPEHLHLQLSGLVAKDEGRLNVYNPIYQFVFDSHWVNKELNELQSEARFLPVSTVLVASVAVTVLVMGVRSLGILEPLELLAYDDLMRRRRAEPLDPRILIVEVTQDDTQNYSYPLSDATVAKVLAKLEQDEPAVIGLDMHRYQPQGQGRQALINQFQLNSTIFTVCAFGTAGENPYNSPPEFSQEQLQYQVGFSDLELDKPLFNNRNLVRRQLLSYEPKYLPHAPLCVTPYSFSFHLAYRFLHTKGIKPLKSTKNQEWQFGNVIFKRLATRTGGYQGLNGDSNQLLLNYRSSVQPAQTVTLTQLLEDKVSQSLIKDRIVIIGTVDPIAKDDFETPYGTMSGVWIHAHLVSQLISAVIDARSLLWVLPQWGTLQWGDALFIWGWSLTGGLMAWRFQSLPHLILVGGTATWLLYQTCFVILTYGGWMPLLPSLLSLFTTNGSLIIYKTVTIRNH